MDGFSFVILERTLDLVTDAMPSEEHRRAAECAEVIRGYIDAPVVDESQLALVVSELADLARENGRFLIATRLRDFARQLRDNGRRLDAA